MWKTLAPIVTGLSLVLVLPAAAVEKLCPGTPFTPVVELKGMLRVVKGQLDSETPIPFEYWELHTAGKTYYLDLRGKELLERAEKLVNRPVVVTGVPEPASPTVRVTGLKADEFVKEKIIVEIRGRLVAHRGVPEWLIHPMLPDDLLPRPRPPREPGPVAEWVIYLGEKSYGLDFEGHKELLQLAKELDGKGVIVTGTRVGEVIHVTGMKADEGSYKETLTVEIQGQLRAPTFDEDDIRHRKDRVLEVFRAPTTITADGKTYRLVFGDDWRLKKLARSLDGKTVVVTGTLKDSVVTVTGLRSADPESKSHLAEVIRTIDGVWASNWGPVTIKYGPSEGDKPVSISGSWVQGPNMTGIIKSGTFDPVKGVLEFAFDEPWHKMSGTAVLNLSADGKTLSGTWKFTNGGGGSWTMTRK
jgi:hypothetical protein